MIVIVKIIIWLNIVSNALGKIVMNPLSGLDGWVSNTIVSAVTGFIMMVIFKYTSNQDAIGRTRDNIKANTLALKLYKDSLLVTLQSQARLFKGAFLLLFHAIRPMAVMLVPVCLILGQLGMWYQNRPLRKNEQAVVIMQLNDNIASSWPVVQLEKTDGAQVVIEQTKVPSKKQIWWKIEAVKNGYHKLTFLVDGRRIEKELAVGDGFMRVSPKRPGPSVSDILLYPAEKPFGSSSAVESISINYPDRVSSVSGTDKWLIYFFVVSMVFALIFKPFLKVKI